MDNRIEEVKKKFDILLHRYLHRDGIYTDAEFFTQVCQLFPQPLDEGLKVLVDGEWVEASKELKDTVRSIEQTLPDKKLREKIDAYVKKCPECGGSGHFTKGMIASPCWRCKSKGLVVDYDQILALLQPKIEEAKRVEDSKSSYIPLSGTNIL